MSNNEKPTGPPGTSGMTNQKAGEGFTLPPESTPHEYVLHCARVVANALANPLDAVLFCELMEILHQHETCGWHKPHHDIPLEDILKACRS